MARQDVTSEVTCHTGISISRDSLEERSATPQIFFPRLTFPFAVVTVYSDCIVDCVGFFKSTFLFFNFLL